MPTSIRAYGFPMNRNLPIAVLAALVVVSLAGPLLAPYNPLEQHREIADAAPSALHWLGTDDYGRDVLFFPLP